MVFKKNLKSWSPSFINRVANDPYQNAVNILKVPFKE